MTLIFPPTKVKIQTRNQAYIYLRVKEVYMVAPVAFQVIFEPGIGQIREFEPRPVHTHINLLGLFLVCTN